MAKRPVAKEIILSVNHGFPQLPQQEDKLFELKGKTTGRNDGGLLDFLDFTGWDHRAIQLLTCSIQDPKGNSKIIRAASSVSEGLGGGHHLGFNRPDPIQQAPPKAVGPRLLPSRTVGEGTSQGPQTGSGTGI